MVQAQFQEVTETPEGAKSSYDKWVESEGIPVIKTFFVEDVRTVHLEPWNRKGGKGAFLQMEGAGQVNNSYICEIAPGQSLRPQRQLFEETIYVLSGRGATTVWNSENQKQTFEWQSGSLFSPPLNTWHQLYDGSGSESARYLAVTTAPTMINLSHNLDFIFHNDFVFADRFNVRQGVSKRYQATADRRKGGAQIEYADEDLIVRQWFEDALAKRGVQSQMAKHQEKNA